MSKPKRTLKQIAIDMRAAGEMLIEGAAEIEAAGTLLESVNLSALTTLLGGGAVESAPFQLPSPNGSTPDEPKQRRRKAAAQEHPHKLTKEQKATMRERWNRLPETQRTEAQKMAWAQRYGVPVRVISLVVSTDMVFWDERCRNLWGVPVGDQIDYNDAIARIHPEDRAATDEAVKQAIAGANGGAYHREFRVVWPDGSVHWISSHGQVLFEGQNDQRHAVRFVGVNMETTDRVLAEGRLRQAQKLESIGLLAGGVAHDFNNLLTVIMGSASSALEECPTCTHSQAVLGASERAAYLTKQLLAYAGKGHLATKVFDLTDLVSRAKPLLSASVPKRVSLSFNLSKDLPPIEVDPTQIEQVLMNLVLNAGEAIPQKTDGRIEIATSNCNVTPGIAREHAQSFDVQTGPHVCLEVMDNGTGMDEQTISRVFDPFFSTKFTGRGLGLAAVHGIVRSTKGFIEVHSRPGSGSTFRVFVPASAKKGTAEEKPEPKSIATREHLGRAGPILVVDDEEMVRKLACMMLRRHGYEVLEATDGKDALRVLQESAALPSLVLLDLAMPVMGGDELVPILEKKYPTLKVIVSSGYPEEETRRGFTSAIVAGFVQKPYTAVVLEEKIGEVLDREPGPSNRIVQFPKIG